MQNSRYKQCLLELTEQIAARTKELTAAITEANKKVQDLNIHSYKSWLADRPDLLEKYELIKDLPRREAAYLDYKNSLIKKTSARIAEELILNPFVIPADIQAKYQFYDALATQLQDTKCDSKQVEEILLNPIFDENARDLLVITRWWLSRVEAGAECVEKRDSATIVASEYFRSLKIIELVPLKEQHNKYVVNQIELELQDEKLQEEKSLIILNQSIAVKIYYNQIKSYATQKAQAAVQAQTKLQRQALEDAKNDLKSAKSQCTVQFQSKLKTNFLSAQIHDFVLDGDQAEFDRLKTLRTVFVQEWARKSGLPVPDAEQAAAIGTVKDNVLVTARAGSGKTSTLTSRAIFLNKHCGVSPDEILLLAFNRAAASEMNARLEKNNCLLPHVMTFHALARAIVLPKETLVYDESNDSPTLSRVFQQVLNDLRKDTEFEIAVRKLMLAHFRADWETLSKKGLNLNQEQGLKFRRALRNETLRGESVKSFGEKAIANFLFEHGVAYNYEYNHWWGGRTYRPDFTIPRGDKCGIVIEYFGLTGKDSYDQMSHAKREYWRRKPDWHFIEFAPNDIAAGIENLNTKLYEKLTKHGVSLQKLSDDEIWKLMKERYIESFAKLARTFVSRCRAADLSPKDVSMLIAKHQPISDIETEFLQLGSTIFSAYLTRNEAENQDDFNGLLERAGVAIAKGGSKFIKKSGNGDLKRIRFIMIDEFQDFTPLFLRMVQAILKHNPQLQVFCVGDDWQAINGFMGSNIEYFKNFDQYFKPTVHLNIATNYRSGSAIVELGNRIMIGKGVPARAAQTHECQVLLADLFDFKPSAQEIEDHPGSRITPALRRLICSTLKDSHNIALISRRQSVHEWVGKIGESNQIENCKKIWTAKIGLGREDQVFITTAHKSKGREADTVIIVDASFGSYPLIHPDWVFTRVFGDSEETILEDELRLFYVASSRAIKRLIYVTDLSKPTEFLENISDSCVQIQWDHYPPVVLDQSRWQVKVGSLEGSGSTPSYSIKDDLKANGFRFDDSGVWKHWAKSFPRANDDTDAVIDACGNQSWSIKSKDIKVQICDQGDNVVAEYKVEAGVWSLKTTN